jgi:hypothetical protein
MPTASIVVEDGVAFRDLNKNGRLDPYKDARLPLAERVADLLAQMTLAEKAGLLFQIFAASPMDRASLMSADLGATPAGQLVTGLLMNHFNFPNFPEARAAAEWQNKMQALAESTRLGIPITFASDPRHAFANNPAVSAMRGSFSQWPEPIIHLDRPAVIPEIVEGCVALLGEFGASDAAVLDVLWGKFNPTGKLPFELPSSMAAVRDQQPDTPCDSANPLFPFGHGLRYVTDPTSYQEYPHD